MGNLLNKFFKGNEEGKVTIDEIIHDFRNYSLYVSISAVVLVIIGLISYICFGSIIVTFIESTGVYEYFSMNTNDDEDIIKNCILISIAFYSMIFGWAFTWMFLCFVKLYIDIKKKFKSWMD